HALHFFARLAYCPHLDEHELTLNARAFRELDHLHHIDQSIQLLGDLLADPVRARRDHGHPPQRGVVGRGDGERLDVVSTCREQPHHSRQGPGFVFQKDGDYMFHSSSPYRSSEPSNISVRPRPAFTMGQTFSVWSVMKSRKTRRSLC